MAALFLRECSRQALRSLHPAAAVIAVVQLPAPPKLTSGKGDVVGGAPNVVSLTPKSAPSLAASRFLTEAGTPGSVTVGASALACLKLQYVLTTCSAFEIVYCDARREDLKHA